MGNFTDFTVLVRPSGWSFDAERGKGKMKAEVLGVQQGHESLVVGKTRTFSVFKLDRNDQRIPAFGTCKDAATEGGDVLELQGYSEPGGHGDYGPITYHTIQKAAVYTGPLPQGASQSSGGSPSRGRENPGNSPSSEGRAMSDDDRRRIVACWSLERAQVQVGASGHGNDEQKAHVGDLVREWGAWYAEQAYRLGLFIADHEAEWTKPVQVQEPVPEEQPQPERAVPKDASDWGARPATGSWGQSEEGGF